MYKILDARDIFDERWTTAEEMDRYLRRRCTRKKLQVVDDDRTPVPYINHSRWVADCPECHCGIGCWDENTHSTCLGCGHRFELDWPPPEDRAIAERLLGERTVATTRNWNVHQDEPLDRLEAENTLLAGVVEGV